MEYQALYRKYRPRNFNDISGQKVTLKILQNAIKNNSISHAYLFFGPRGTGKTSIAKIFARAVNCNEQEDGIQCEKCNNCLISKEKECVDIVEIDAASNNGVDEIRELKSKVSFVPSELKYKVYIIDEVHMLSIGAFNALLKTLEEPPEHIIFILATTELQKVPSTIISRCQTLEFKKISDQDMNTKLSEIATKEQIVIDEEAIEEIVKYSNGGLRDAIGLLEKAKSYSEEKINSNTIKEISGNITNAELKKFLSYFESKNIEKLLLKINEYYESGIDLIKVTDEIIKYKMDQIISEKKYDTYNCSIIKQLNELSDLLKKSENPKIIFEITIINILMDESNDNVKPIKKRTTEEPKSELPKQESENETNSIRTSSLKEIRIANTLCDPQKKIISEIRSNWENLKDLAFDNNYGNIARLLSSDILPVAASESNVILISKLSGLAEQINNDIYKVEKIFEIIFKNKYKPICISEKEWNECIEIYKKDKNHFKKVDESDSYIKEEVTLKDKAKELFENI